MFTPIPQPPAIPFLGNVNNIDSELPVRSLLLLAKQYGAIWQMVMFGKQIVFVSTQKLSHQVADETRFRKDIAPALEEVRNLVGDGLFTAYHDEPNWGIAHRILMPAFGPASIRNMFDDMVDISDQLCLKWERFGPSHIIDPADDFTRLAFDTIALCAMDYRLNSFYQKELPEFIEAMGSFLAESGNRSRRPRVVQAVMRQTNAQYTSNIKLMNDLAEQIIADRRANPIAKKDLLNMMINGRDPKTGEGLSDENIRNQLVTFLIAGHETTSGMLSFALYHLMRNPQSYLKLQAEVDSVLGNRTVQLDDLPKMPYLHAVLHETLRITSPIVARSSAAIDDTVLVDGDKQYEIKKGTTCVVLFAGVHRDSEVYGDNADEFSPERMLDGKFEALPHNAWEPFGNGARACIGRPFAWQEGQIALASVIQRFDLRMHDPSYTLELKQTLTVKPKNFRIHVTRRSGEAIVTGHQNGGESTLRSPGPIVGLEVSGSIGAQPLYVFYGSNTGSSEAFAQKIATNAAANGYMARIGTLDSVAGRLPTDGPVIIVTASFEGEPADNAGHFVEYLRNINNPKELANIHYAVFGCGNHEWVRTYQKIPRLCDELISKAGGERILDRGEGDAAGSSFFEEFDEWESKLWGVLQKKFGGKVTKLEVGSLEVKMTSGTERAATLRQEASLAKVVENRVLTKTGAPVKRHIEFELPEGMHYNCGDYLSILPTNPPASVKRVLTRFKLAPEQEITITSKTPTTLPTDKPVSITELLGGYVEISQPATKRNLQELVELATGTTKSKLEAMTSAFAAEIHDKRLSVLDLLETFPDIDMPFATFLQLLPSMRIRQYSISSSPLWNAQHVTLTVGILDSPATSGKAEKFLGVASNYIANLQPGDLVQVNIRPSAAAFHLPEDPSVPIIMFAAGSGIAPMRGFMQERAFQAKSGRAVGKSILFFGCRNPQEDYLYSEAELKEWTEAGVVKVFPAFSRAIDLSDGCKYVQDRVWKEKQLVQETFKQGAKLYTCGTAGVSNGIKEACIRIIEDSPVGKEKAEAFFAKIQKERFATDVFG